MDLDPRVHEKEEMVKQTRLDYILRQIHLLDVGRDVPAFLRYDRDAAGGHGVKEATARFGVPSRAEAEPEKGSDRFRVVQAALILSGSGWV